MSVYQQTPVTLDGRDIDPAAPRSQGMSDEAAQTVSDAAAERRENVLHLHADVADYDATITVANAPDASELYLDYGDGNGERLTRDAGEEGSVDVTRTHTYIGDGVYTAAVYQLSGPPASAQLEIPVNWPAPFPVPPAPEEP